ncbi:MAG: hypothetical protein JWR44_794 [Hymenobacter sp.]|nr:hypothetical protein [Hymenobacter sp.]
MALPVPTGNHYYDLPLDSCPAGTYFYSLTVDGQPSATRRLVVQ